jgi:RNA polymerase sigma-70 factor (ECF subfamily)
VKETQELEIWHKFKKGDKQALARIYECYSKSMYAYGKRISADDSLVMDCIQDVFIKLIDSRDHLQITESTHLYLFKSLRNEILGELRSEKRKRNISLSIYESSSSVSSIEQSIVQSEAELHKRALVDQAINRLTDHQREAIFLRYKQQFDYEEIADLLEIDVPSARTLVYRSLKKVKEDLSGKVSIILGMIWLAKS